MCMCVCFPMCTFFRASIKVHPWETFLGRMKDPLPGMLKHQNQDEINNNKYAAGFHTGTFPAGGGNRCVQECMRTSVHPLDFI